MIMKVCECGNVKGLYYYHRNKVGSLIFRITGTIRKSSGRIIIKLWVGLFLLSFDKLFYVF